MAYYNFILTFVLFIALGIRSSNAQAWTNYHCQCGIPREGISNRITGGYEAIPNSYPWTVVLLNDGQFACSGTLINDRYVLTAGHCVKWVNPASMTVALGVHSIGHMQPTDIVPIDNIILHEGFMSYDMYDVNDLALIRLQTPIQMDQDKARMICLPREGIDYTNSVAKVVGWGDVSPNGPSSDVLREADVNIIPFDQCQANGVIGSYVTNSMICAFGNGNDACQGDSGGPLMRLRNDYRFELIGVVSWGLGCGYSAPGVYVKNIDYKQWILYNTGDAIYCQDP